MVYTKGLNVKKKWQSAVSNQQSEVGIRRSLLQKDNVDRVYGKKELLFRRMYSTIHII